jgi:hypothetical protein
LKEIEITIDENGEISLDLQGFHGKGCSDLVKKLTQAMKGRVKLSKKKNEYYKVEEQQKQKINRSM